MKEINGVFECAEKSLRESTAIDMIISVWEAQQSMKKMNEAMGILFEHAKCEIREHIEKRENDIEFILRNKIDVPIKGEITAGKLRWRGIKSIAFGPEREFLGVLQRGKVVGVDGIVDFPTGYGKLHRKY